MGTDCLRMTFEKGIFLVKTDYASRNIPKNAGFAWSTLLKCYYTQRPTVALKLAKWADSHALRKLERELIILRSPPALKIKPKTEPMPFQLNAAEWALTRNRSYIAADAGLGKSAIASIIVNTLNQPAIAISPPSLCYNLKNEFSKWCNQTEISVFPKEPLNPFLNIVPDSLLNREDVLKALVDFTTKSEFHRLSPILIIDEAHRFKTLEAARTFALFHYLVPFFRTVVFMSGTPMPNRPIELFPVLNFAAPEVISFKSYFDFGREYCNGYKDERGHWNFLGHSNTDKLFSKMREKFVLRIKKAEVLSELPEKLEEIVLLDEEKTHEIIELEAKLLSQKSPEDLMNENGDHIATYRKLVGELKVPLVAGIAEDILESTNESILIFAHHKSVVNALSLLLNRFKPLVITGATPKETRLNLVQEFQEDKSKRVFILNLEAGGTGFTLTKATRVLVAEMSWVPGANDQAIDRAHRIGQTEKVLAQYLVLRDSLDAKIMNAVLGKRRIINNL